METLKFIQENVAWIAPMVTFIVSEFILRRVPTEKSVSIIDGIKFIFDKVIPNIKIDERTGKTRDAAGDLNTH